MGGSPAKVIKKVVQAPVKILSSPLGQTRQELGGGSSIRNPRKAKLGSESTQYG